MTNLFNISMKLLALDLEQWINKKLSLVLFLCLLSSTQFQKTFHLVFLNNRLEVWISFYKSQGEWKRNIQSTGCCMMKIIAFNGLDPNPFLLLCSCKTRAIFKFLPPTPAPWCRSSEVVWRGWRIGAEGRMPHCRDTAVLSYNLGSKPKSLEIELVFHAYN